MEAEHRHGDDSDEGLAGGSGEEHGDVQGLSVCAALALPGSGDAPAALCHACHLGGPQGEQVKESPRLCALLEGWVGLPNDDQRPGGATAPGFSTTLVPAHQLELP